MNENDVNPNTDPIEWIEPNWPRDYEKDMLEHYKEQCNGYKEFIKFLVDDCAGKTDGILEAIDDCASIDFLGYVDGELSVKNNELKITVEVPDSFAFNGRETRKIVCDWQHADNYGVCQHCHFEDEFYGWMIFPCYSFKRFYCVYYTC